MVGVSEYEITDISTYLGQNPYSVYQDRSTVYEDTYLVNKEYPASDGELI